MVAPTIPHAFQKATLAPTLVDFRSEINTLWPNRDKSTDGWLGDAAHQARISQHNPDKWRIVRAIDIDKDGINVNRVIKAAIGAPGVWYIIHNGIIWSRTYNWRPRKYTGPNPHKGHIHISILLGWNSAFISRDWLTPQAVATNAPRPTQSRDLSQGMHGTDVAKWQKALGIQADGIFGPKTTAAVNSFKRRHNLKPDGIIGARVRKLLRDKVK